MGEEGRALRVHWLSFAGLRPPGARPLALPVAGRAGACARAAGGRGKMAELGKKYCVYCLAEVSSLRFRCTDCADIELCPDCFSAGAEIGPHRRWHGYQLVDGGRFTLWGAEAEGGWSSREEQLLLDAIEQFGFGNWVRAAGGGRGAARRGGARPSPVRSAPAAPSSSPAAGRGSAPSASRPTRSLSVTARHLPLAFPVSYGQARFEIQQGGPSSFDSLIVT